MKQDVALACRCGKVQGVLRGASPRTVNRAVCYCDDCQAFAHHLGRADLLDAHGGSDIVQAAPAAIVFERGTEHIAGVRLKPKGLFRWYAACCKTPLGNHVTPAVPFVGIVHEAFASVGDSARRDAVFGPPRGRIFGKFAIGEPPPGSTTFDTRLILGSVARVLSWKIRGGSWPHPFLERATNAPRYPLTVLTLAERDALRAKCGPRAV